MNQQDKSFLVTFTSVMTVLVLLAVAIFLISRGVTVLDSTPDDGKRRAVTALDRIRPVGTVAVATPAPAGSEAAQPKSGAEVVASICGSCHQSGVLNAPKIGDKAAWEARLAQGMDTLVDNAVNGLNAMPAKGGNPNLSEQEIRNAIVQMLADSGLEAGDGGGAAAAPAQEQQAAGGADLAKGQEIYNSACVACHQAGVLNAPKLGDKADWESRLAQGMDTLVEHAINGLNAMPAKGGNPTLSDDDIRNAVAYMVGESGAAMAAAPADDTAQAAPASEQAASEQAAPEQAAPASEQAAPEQTAPEQATPAPAALPADLDLAKGQQLYNTACVICHQQGIANAPKLGDKDAWAPRLEQGFDTLVTHAIDGYKGMPPKGGRMDVPDADIRAAVGYMAKESQ